MSKYNLGLKFKESILRLSSLTSKQNLELLENLANEEGDKDIFVHISALQNSGIRNLFEDQNVEYDVAEEKGKVSAVNIKLIED